MAAHNRRRSAVFKACPSGLALAALLLAGCSGGGPKPPAPDVSADNLTAIANAYILYASEKKTPPKSAEDLKAAVPQITQTDFLTSSRDGQPFVILWGADPSAGMGEQPLVIGYEKEGKDGFRFVATAMGVMMMDDEGFAQANFPAGHTPP